MLSISYQYVDHPLLISVEEICKNFLNESFYMLGKIYEGKGWKGKAIEHYEKFLDLWKDADPGRAEVEDAKKKLNGLKSQ